MRDHNGKLACVGVAREIAMTSVQKAEPFTKYTCETAHIR